MEIQDDKRLPECADVMICIDIIHMLVATQAGHVVFKTCLPVWIQMFFNHFSFNVCEFSQLINQFYRNHRINVLSDKQDHWVIQEPLNCLFSLSPYFIKKKKCVIYSIVIYSIVKRYNTGVVMFNFMPLLGESNQRKQTGRNETNVSLCLMYELFSFQAVTSLLFSLVFILYTQPNSNLHY